MATEIGCCWMAECVVDLLSRTDRAALGANKMGCALVPVVSGRHDYAVLCAIQMVFVGIRIQTVTIQTSGSVCVPRGLRMVFASRGPLENLDREPEPVIAEDPMALVLLRPARDLVDIRAPRFNDGAACSTPPLNTGRRAEGADTADVDVVGSGVVAGLIIRFPELTAKLVPTCPWNVGIERVLESLDREFCGACGGRRRHPAWRSRRVWNPLSDFGPLTAAE